MTTALGYLASYLLNKRLEQEKRKIEQQQQEQKRLQELEDLASERAFKKELMDIEHQQRLAELARQQEGSKEIVRMQMQPKTTESVGETVDWFNSLTTDAQRRLYERGWDINQGINAGMRILTQTPRSVAPQVAPVTTVPTETVPITPDVRQLGTLGSLAKAIIPTTQAAQVSIPTQVKPIQQFPAVPTTVKTLIQPRYTGSVQDIISQIAPDTIYKEEEKQQKSNLLSFNTYFNSLSPVGKQRLAYHVSTGEINPYSSDWPTQVQFVVSKYQQYLPGAQYFQTQAAVEQWKRGQLASKQQQLKEEQAAFNRYVGTERVKQGWARIDIARQRLISALTGSGVNKSVASRVANGQSLSASELRYIIPMLNTAHTALTREIKSMENKELLLSPQEKDTLEQLRTERRYIGDLINGYARGVAEATKAQKPPSQKQPTGKQVVKSGTPEAALAVTQAILGAISGETPKQQQKQAAQKPVAQKPVQQQKSGKKVDEKRIQKVLSDIYTNH